MMSIDRKFYNALHCAHNLLLIAHSFNWSFLIHLILGFYTIVIVDVSPIVAIKIIQHFMEGKKEKNPIELELLLRPSGMPSCFAAGAIWWF